VNLMRFGPRKPAQTVRRIDGLLASGCCYTEVDAAASGCFFVALTAMNAAPYGPKRAENPSMQPISLDRISEGG
jgi:hypothetical protein